jgi:hypothetical protein
MDQPRKRENHDGSTFEAADCTAVCRSINRDLRMIGPSGGSVQTKPKNAGKCCLILFSGPGLGLFERLIMAVCGSAYALPTSDVRIPRVLRLLESVLHELLHPELLNRASTVPPGITWFGQVGAIRYA